MVIGCSESINVGPLCVILTLSLLGSKRRESSQKSLGLCLCPVMTVTKTSALLRMEPNCPSRKFQGKLGQFLQLSVVPSIMLTLTVKILPFVSAFLWDNLYFFLATMCPPVHPLHFWRPSFYWRDLSHLSPSSRFSTFMEPSAQPRNWGTQEKTTLIHLNVGGPGQGSLVGSVLF